jgi:hypothetical protein
LCFFKVIERLPSFVAMESLNQLLTILDDF